MSAVRAICPRRGNRPQEDSVRWQSTSRPPSSLARPASSAREVIEKCMELGVPIFQGRIDKTLFLANLGEHAAATTSRSPRSSAHDVRAAPGARRHRIALLSSRSRRRSEMEAGTTRRRHVDGFEDDRRPAAVAPPSSYGDRVAARHKGDGEWHDVTLRARSARSSREIGLGLIDLGIEPGDRVCAPRQHAPRVDVRATSRSRAPARVVVPIYPTNSPEECEWVAGNSESRRGRLRGRRAGRQDRRGPRPPAGPAARSS